MKRFLALLAIFLCSASVKAQNETVILDKAAEQRLLGAKKFSLQWISWDYFGKVTIRKDGRTLRLSGRQDSREDTDFVSIDGIITEVNATEFKFRGKIITQVSYINDGKPCLREGDYTFRITGKRRYWRLKEMDNPCEAVVDYVDIYFN